MTESILVLVVEDDEAIQLFVSEILEGGGYTIQLVKDGEEAVAALDANAAEFRALLTDVDLGRGQYSGWNVARHAREIVPDLPVVYMSGANGDDWKAVDTDRRSAQTKSTRSGCQLAHLNGTGE